MKDSRTGTKQIIREVEDETLGITLVGGGKEGLALQWTVEGKETMVNR